LGLRILHCSGVSQRSKILDRWIVRLPARRRLSIALGISRYRPAVLEAALRAPRALLRCDCRARRPQPMSFSDSRVVRFEAGVVVIPAMGFYGGLGDLLATAAKADWTDVDEIQIAVALDSWLPTRGTRLTGQAHTARRLVVANNRLEPLDDPPPTRKWDFPARSDRKASSHCLSPKS
jgi:hypothetical protein